VKQEYLVLIQIGGAGDPEIWRAGSAIWLTDEQAAIHLAAGNIAAINKTILPEPEPSAVVVHEPASDEAPVTTKKGK